MELRFAFLANGVEVTPDGRFFALGGGIDAIGVPSVPVTFPALALLAQIHFGSDEFGRVYEIGLTLTLPDGSDADLRLKTTVTPEPAEYVKQNGNTVHVHFSFYGLPLPDVGTYTFNILVDGRPIGHQKIAVGIVDRLRVKEERHADSDVT